MLSPVPLDSRFSGENSPDQSSCSSDTGEVLIRSTRVRPGSGPVQITVQKVRDPLRSSLTPQEQRRDSRRIPGEEAADSDAAQRPAAAAQPGEDVLTSRFTAGGRGAVLAVLKQRSHSAPHRREVRVQLLDQRPSQTATTHEPRDTPALTSRDGADEAGAPTEAGLSSGYHGVAGNAAVVAAAAVAAAAPLIKAQSDMEARLSQLADGVHRLLHADREDRGRSLSRQTLQQLETLQTQQLQLQSQLLESALRIVTGHAHTAADCTAAGLLQNRHQEAAANGLGDQLPRSSPTGASPAAAADAATGQSSPVTMETRYSNQWPEQNRADRSIRGTSFSIMSDGIHPQSSANQSQEAVRRANEVLRQMERLKNEMKMLTEPEVSLRTTRPVSNHLKVHHSQQDQSHHHQNQPQQKQTQPTKPKQNAHRNTKSKHNKPYQNRFNHTDPKPKHHQQPSAQQIQSHQNQHQQSNPKQNHLHSQSSNTQQNQHQHTSPRTTELQPDQLIHSHTQSHQIQSQHTSTNEDHLHCPPQTHQTPSQPNEAKHQKSQQNHFLPRQNQSQQTVNQDHLFWAQSSQSQFHQNQNQQPDAMLAQRRPVAPSVLEEAGRVLRQVRKKKKVLEENLEAVLRARTGEVLNCQLEALAANRDLREEVRIKKTVDAWISTLTRDIQAEMSSEDGVILRRASDAVAISHQGPARSSGHAGRGGPVGRGRGSKTVQRMGGRGPTSRHRLPLPLTDPEGAVGRPTEGKQVVVHGESYLSHLYGKAAFEGLRRTLKKGPYLRFSSPTSPLGRKPRPRLVESVRGVKMKSCKTQTSLAPPPNFAPPHSSSQLQRHLFSSSQLNSGDPSGLTMPPVVMAIPLGCPRIDSSRCERVQEVTSPATPPPIVSLAVGTPEHHQQSHAEEAPPPPSSIINIVQAKGEEPEEEENIFPGMDFLSVADVQEMSGMGEGVVELHGGPSPPPATYQGPVFPPEAPSTLPVQDQPPVPSINPQRDALENRLVEWVEQQLMSRVISEMYHPPLHDPTHDNHTDQSGLEVRSVTSDIVEAAGDGGYQLFVHSNMAVDSDLIRQLVDEVLTETITQMLGQRDPLQPGPEPVDPGLGAHQEDDLPPLVPTPVTTPPQSPLPQSREPTAVSTPPPSEPASPVNEKPPQPITAPDPVATPTPSPQPTPSVRSPSAVHQSPPPLPWEGAELPLDEERPEEHAEIHQQPLFMSVAEEEPQLSSPLPASPPSNPPARSLSPQPKPSPASPSSFSEDLSSSSSGSSSSTTVTAGTEAALKHISEGELLISINQPAATTEVEAGCSFSNSLQELQDMDFDPPSEGEVKGRDLLLTLLIKRGERPQPEGSWGREIQEEEEEEGSMGEVRDGQTPDPTQHGQTRSPGQMSQAADVSGISIEDTNQDSITTGNAVDEPMGTLTSDLHTHPSPSPPPPQLEDALGARQVVMVTPYDRRAAGVLEEEDQVESGRPPASHHT
ncbi:protein TALPID3-like isoform 2-T2 [Pholidichthys leucotaenia]